MKFRKVLLALSVLLFLAAAAAGTARLLWWNWPTHLPYLDPDEVYWVELYSGIRSNIITDRETIEYLTGTFNNTTFRRRLHDPDRFILIFGGSGISFRFRDGESLSIGFILKSGQTVGYGGYWWEAYPPGLDVGTISSLTAMGSLPE